MLNYKDLFEWLKDKYPDTADRKIYENLEEVPEIQTLLSPEGEKKFEFQTDPRLPIDLILAEEKEIVVDEEGPQFPIDVLAGKDIKKKKKFKKATVKEKRPHYTLFLIIPDGAITDSIEKRISFYRLYLSTIVGYRLKIVVICSKKPNADRIGKLNNAGFGLWIITNRLEKHKEIHPAYTLRHVIKTKFEKSELIDSNDSLSSKADDISLFAGGVVLETVDTIAGVTPEQFGKRYIDRNLLISTLSLRQISYRKELADLVTKHLVEKSDEFNFVSDVFNKLWLDCIGLQYTDFLEKFEPSLQYIFAEKREKTGKIYRDHYIHQFQVFLLGLFIIDKLYDVFKDKDRYKYPELSWLIASSFHDVAYPVQLYNTWSGDFFQSILKIPKEKNPGILELKSAFIERSFLTSIAHIITMLLKVHIKEDPIDNWLDKEQAIVNFFCNSITRRENQDHGVLSSISLSKILSEKNERDKIKQKFKKDFKEVFQDLFVPSMLSIALHDSNILNGICKGAGKCKSSLNRLGSLNFNDDPLTFLLIFCDNVQEWGRPSKIVEKKIRDKTKRFLLQEFEFDTKKQKFRVCIKAPYHDKSAEFFDKKQGELRDLEVLIGSNKPQFTIRLEDKDGAGEDFMMRGSIKEIK